MDIYQKNFQQKTGIASLDNAGKFSGSGIGLFVPVSFAEVDNTPDWFPSFAGHRRPAPATLRQPRRLPHRSKFRRYRDRLLGR
jgi:hypothetical protein